MHAEATVLEPTVEPVLGVLGPEENMGTRRPWNRPDPRGHNEQAERQACPLEYPAFSSQPRHAHILPLRSDLSIYLLPALRARPADVPGEVVAASEAESFSAATISPDRTLYDGYSGIDHEDENWEPYGKDEVADLESEVGAIATRHATTLFKAHTPSIHHVVTESGEARFVKGGEVV